MAGRRGIAIVCATDGDGGDGLCARVFARACARVRVCVRACVRTRVHACVYARMHDVFAIYDKIFDPG